MTQLEDLDVQIQNQLICGIIPQFSDEANNVALVQLSQLDMKVTSKDISAVIGSELDLLFPSPSNEYSTYHSLLKIESKLKESKPISDELINQLLQIQNLESEFEYYVFLRAFSLIIGSGILSKYWDSMMEKWYQFDRYPLKSNVLGWHFFEKIISQIAIILKSDIGSTSDIQILRQKYTSLFGSSKRAFGNVISYQCLFAYAFSSSNSLIKELSNLYIKYFKDFIHHSKFPKATEKTTSLDSLAYTVANLNQKYGIFFGQDTASVLERALEKSFQSISVMKAISVTSRDIDKLKGSVKIYLNYEHTQAVQNGGKYVDLIDVIDTLRTILSRNPLALSREEGFDTLEDFVIKFIESFDITENSILSLPLKKLLAGIWFDLGKYLKAITQSNLYTVPLADYLDTIKKYFSNAESLVRTFPEKTASDAVYFFELSYSLVKTGDYKEALKHIKQAVKLNPNEIMYANLLVLMYSALDDNKDKALDVSSKISESLTATLQSTTSEYKTENEKWNIMQFFMTHIALVQFKYDVYEAIELLPEFLSNMHSLLYSEFSDLSHNGNSVFGNEGSQGLTHDGKSKSNNVLDKVKTTTKHVVQSNGSPPSKSKRHSLAKTQNKVHKSDKVFQECWLWCAKLYQQAGMLEDAESCISEAHLYSCNDGHIESSSGFLAISHNKNEALKLFESSLRKGTSIEAAVGLAVLALDSQGEGIENSIFMGPVDSQVALARAKKYLETFATEYPTSQQSEIYHYLSKIYEVTGHLVKLEETLWKCVELEDYRPIRPWYIIEGTSI